MPKNNNLTIDQYMRNMQKWGRKVRRDIIKLEEAQKKQEAYLKKLSGRKVRTRFPKYA